MEPATPSQKKISIIDDDADIRAIYQKEFETDGFTVTVAADGSSGLTLIRAQKPDIILLDLQMPVLDGLGVLGELQKDAALKDIPVVVLSNLDNDKLFQLVESFHVKYYLIKVQTDPQKVVEFVDQILLESSAPPA